MMSIYNTQLKKKKKKKPYCSLVHRKIHQNSWWQWNFGKGILSGKKWRIQQQLLEWNDRKFFINNNKTFILWQG